MGCYLLLQGTFLTQGSNPRLLHWQEDFTTEPFREAHTSCTGQEWNLGQLLERQLCSPLYHQQGQMQISFPESTESPPEAMFLVGLSVKNSLCPHQ